MYTKLLWLVVAATIWISPTPTFAHDPGEPPLVHVNSEPAVHYPVSFSSLPDLNLPVDAAPSIYLLNTVIRFELDEAAIPLFPEQIPDYDFTWVMGDGTTKQGLSVEHTYTNPGTYVVTQSMRSKVAIEESIELGTLNINIAPTSDYNLPTPVLSVNGIMAKDTLIESIQASFTKKVVLDATKSKRGSAQIASYTWDLGNKQLSRDGKVTVSYDNLFSTVQPVVRITDKNNLYVDATIELTNATLPNPDGSIPNVKTQGQEMSLGLKLLLALIVLAAPTLLTRYFARKQR